MQKTSSKNKFVSQNPKFSLSVYLPLLLCLSLSQ